MRIFVFFLILCSFSKSYAFNFFEHPYSEPLTEVYFPEKIIAPKENTFFFDPVHLQWAVYTTSGKRVGVGKAVGGKDFCSDTKESCKTVEGNFTIFRKEDSTCTSNTFPMDGGGGAPMPHCMFFHKGYAIHGSNNLPNKNSSHGCIRVSNKAAEWMSTYYLKTGSTVVVLAYDGNFKEAGLVPA